MQARTGAWQIAASYHTRALRHRPPPKRLRKVAQPQAFPRRFRRYTFKNCEANGKGGVMSEKERVRLTQLTSKGG